MPPKGITRSSKPTEETMGSPSSTVSYSDTVTSEILKSPPRRSGSTRFPMQQPQPSPAPVPTLDSTVQPEDTAALFQKKEILRCILY